MKLNLNTKVIGTAVTPITPAEVDTVSGGFLGDMFSEDGFSACSIEAKCRDGTTGACAGSSRCPCPPPPPPA